MSVSKWAYTPEVCDGEICVGDCDLCDIPIDEYMNMECPNLEKNDEAWEAMRDTLGFAMFRAVRSIEKMKADIVKIATHNFGGHKND